MTNLISSDEYAPYFGHYISLVETPDLIREMKRSLHLTQVFFCSVNEIQAEYRYAANKWSVKEVLQHIIDTERVMSYRALCISRGDKTPLPGFDQDLFIENGNAAKRSLSSLLTEHEAVRKASIALFEMLNEEQFVQMGTASNNLISVRALAYVIIGHEIHHLNILKERYLGNILNF